MIFQRTFLCEMMIKMDFSLILLCNHPIDLYENSAILNQYCLTSPYFYLIINDYFHLKMVFQKYQINFVTIFHFISQFIDCWWFINYLNYLNFMKIFLNFPSIIFYSSKFDHLQDISLIFHHIFREFYPINLNSHKLISFSKRFQVEVLNIYHLLSDSY